MIEERECWNCGEVYDINEYSRCPECEEYWEDDPDMCSDDWEECEEDEDNENNLNNNDMTLATLKEEKRIYKGLKPFLTYISENYSGLEDQFTSSLLEEVASEAFSNKKAVITYNNRLFRVNIFNCNFNSLPTLENTPKIESYNIYTYLGTSIDGPVDKQFANKYISIKDIYIVEDETELLNLEIVEKERVKVQLIKDQKEHITKKEEEIADQKQYVADVKKYNTTDRDTIKKLKAVEVVRNSKATNEEVMKAIEAIANCW